MIEHQLVVSGTSKLIIRDRSDETPSVIQMYIQTPTTKTTGVAPWRYKMEMTLEDPKYDYDSGWQSFNVKSTNELQLLRSVYASTSTEKIHLYLGASGNSVIDGPATLSITVARGVPKAYITHDGVKRMAIPYVCTAPGVWKLAEPMINVDGSSWKVAT